jgi:hypothetical protein
MNGQRIQKQCSPVTHVIRSTMLDAALGGACAASYGIVFAGFGAAAHEDSERILTTIVYFGLCGVMGGGVFGTIGALIDVLEPHEPVDVGARRCPDTADVVVPRRDAPSGSEGTNYVTLARKSHQEQLEMRMSRMLGSQFPRTRASYESNFVDSSPWEN